MKINIANIAKFFAVTAFFLFAFTSYAKDNEKDGKQKKNFVVNLTTNFGDIKFMLLNETPLHRDNFVKLVKEGFYNDILCHRVVDNFVIQAGDPSTKTNRLESDRAAYGEDGGKYTISAEILPQFHHYRGALGAAREGDDVNPERRSSGTQFYFVQRQPSSTPIDVSKIKNSKPTKETLELYNKRGGTPHLDGGYTVFGYVLEGMSVVDKICKVKRDKKDLPLQDVVIKRVKIEKISRKKIDKKYEYYAE